RARSRRRWSGSSRRVTPHKSSISWRRRSPIRGNGPHPFGGITSRDGGGKLADSGPPRRHADLSPRPGLYGPSGGIPAEPWPDGGRERPGSRRARSGRRRAVPRRGADLPARLACAVPGGGGRPGRLAAQRYVARGRAEWDALAARHNPEPRPIDLHVGAAPVAVVFFFQAEDGIRDRNVTGVQTCALPI